MNKALIDYIDIDLIQEEIYDPLKDSVLLKNELAKKQILMSGNFKKGFSTGTFEDDLWVVENGLNNQYSYIDFSELKCLKFVGIDQDDILAIKSWVANNLLKNFNVEQNESDYVSSKKKYNHLFSFIKDTKNFSNDFIDQEEGFGIEYYFDNKNQSDRVIYDNIFAILDFIYSTENYFLQKFGETGSIYMERLYNYLKKITYKKIPRELPQTRDILLFSHYVNKFFYNDNTVNEQDKMEYYPILLWWKITNIIPMRPSEFCTKIPRDCLIKEEDNFYIKIGRIKQKANVKRRLLPVLDRLKISKEIYELICDYINKTDIKKYGPSETLISYRATIYFRKVTAKKINYNRFSLAILDGLIKKFYSDIIKKKYNEFTIKTMIKPGDTRHFAFTSLLLQGITPPYIAIMGGHRNLKTLDHYTCSSSYYADSEIIKYVNSVLINKNENMIENEDVMEIVSKMPSKCPKDIHLCIPMYDVGFCMLDFAKEPYSCEDEIFCFKCSKWWCEPSIVNAKHIIKKIKNEEIFPRRKIYEQNIEFLLELLKNVGLEVINNELVINEEDFRELKRLSLNIKSDIDSIASDTAMIISNKQNNFIENKIVLSLNNVLNILNNIDD